ncbi:AsmA family protein [Pseudodesulfovibrio sp. F-1]|uniref:AsmA family protein n=1 Tax=Pseudodesulfovibrio alkaliphilus TaxID=2661613 RepID=A0A7K1KPV4_9BACT|nr:AsmA family protein [Pseudodesulfovibrio alkaliphilus]MUM78123.1 AsmA family protein [Pseudodesulfovibrio alkaliphilus]
MIGRVGKVVLEAVVACVIVVAAVLLWASFYVDSEEFRLRFTSMAEGVLGRPVHLEGGLDIALYPMPSLEVRGLIVEDAAEYGATPLAEIDIVHVIVRLMPLISGSVEIESIVARGVRVNVVRPEQGTFNWLALLEDMGRREGSGTASFRVDTVSLSGLEISDASIVYRDHQGGVHFDLGGIDLRTGGIRSGQRVPFVADSDFSWGHEGVQSKLTIQGMVRMDEDWSGFALEEASLSASIGGRFLPRGASPAELTARLTADWDKGVVALEGIRGRFLGLMVEGSLHSTDLGRSLGASGTVTLHPFSPAKVITRYAPGIPVSKVDGLERSTFSTALNVDANGLFFSGMTLTLDDQTLRGDLSLRDFNTPVWTFDLRGDAFDLDRYLPLIMTDEPFIWADYPLGFARDLRGKGTLSMDSFRLFETTSTDVRLAVDAQGGAIEAEASAVVPDGVHLKTGAHFALGRDEASGNPTLALRGELRAELLPVGFAPFATGALRLIGPSTLVARVETSSLVCPPDVRSIGILRALSGEVELSLGRGRVGIAGRDGGIVYREVARAVASSVFKSRGGTSGDKYDFSVSTSVDARGAVQGESLIWTMAGPLALGIDAPFVAGKGLSTSGQVSGPIFLGREGALTLAGELAFDTRSHTASLVKGVLTTLGADLLGEVHVTNMDTRFNAAGQFSLPRLDPRRSIGELGGGHIATKDPEALGSASLACRFTLDADGFILDDVIAELDGMPISGRVVGTGLSSPMLAFDFDAGALDIDRYLPPSPTEEERQAGRAPRNPPVDLPLNFLRGLRLDGQGRFQEFKLGKIRARDFSAKVHADKGIIHVGDVKGTVHEGTLTGELAGQVVKDSLVLKMRLGVTQMQAGLLLEDVAGRDYVRGATQVSFDLESSGRTDDDILANLNGSAQVQIRNGSFKFTGYEVKSSTEPDRSIGQIADDPRTRRTSFWKAYGEFAVQQGVFTANTFRVEAPPVLQCYGTGWFSLPDDTINLAIRNDFVVVPSLTIELVGKLSNPEVRIPKDRILNDTVRNILSLPERSFNFLRDLFK